MCDRLSRIMALVYRKLAFLDVETTGFSFRDHEIIELGVVIAGVDEKGTWRMLQEIDIKIQPQHIETAEAEALRINGYTPEAWMFAHTLTQAMQELSAKAKDATMVAHNVAFDYGFIEAAFRSTGVENTMHYQKLDTISIAFAKLANDPDAKNLSLRSLCDYFGIMNERAHTALADARATFEVFKELMKM